MWTERVYGMLLGLYPEEFRVEFGGEMTAVFAQGVAQRSGCWWCVAWFTAREIGGLLAASIEERWRDSESRREYPVFPSDIAGAEKYVEIVSRRCILAIAQHDFESARYYDVQDRKARRLLDRLRA